MEVKITNFEFVPADVTIKKGQTVVWENLDEDVIYIIKSGIPDSKTDLFESPPLEESVRFSRTFDQVGYFPYYSAYHASVFGGSVTVTE